MTATRAEKLTIYAAGLVQGITLVTFPAASTIFTSPGSYHLTCVPQLRLVPVSPGW